MSFLKATNPMTAAVLLVLLSFGPTTFAERSQATDGRELMGSWVVSRVVATAPVTSLTKQESKELVGRTVAYNLSSFRTGNTSFEVKGYTRRTLTEDEFLTQNKLPLAKIGVARPRVVAIEVHGKDEDVADQFGAWVYFLNKNVNIVAFGGVFFELKRATDSK